MKTIKEINEKIRKGEAIILTAKEFCDMIRKGEKIKDVDVVTTATCGIMSGTMAVFSFKIAEKGVFIKAKEVLMNGIPVFPGPCPNERIGYIDVVLYGPSVSIYNEKYGGGELIKDLIDGKYIDVYVKSIEGKEIEDRINLNNMIYAKIITTRSCYKNYMAFINPREESIRTIFSVIPMKKNMITVSGCGELNPLEKDPLFKTIGIGSKILVNKAIGYVIGTGTRSVRERPNLSLCANIKEMSSYFIGQFITSFGPEIYNTIAIPIPILNEEILNNVKRTDNDIILPIADVYDRSILDYSNYANIWQGTDIEVKYYEDICKNCKIDPCPVSLYCPTRAFNNRILNKSLCFECGTCTWLCPNGAFKANLGKIKFKDREIPISSRLSCLKKAEILANYLKSIIEKGEFYLNEPSDKILI